MAIFITPDGTYGNLSELVTINTDAWNDTDWELFEEVAQHGNAADTIETAHSLNIHAHNVINTWGQR